MKKAALYVGIIAALICGTTFAAVISGTSVGSSAVYTTPVPAQYVAASYGSALANESIAAGTDSALYCAMDNLDGTTSTPECGLNAIRHKGVGPFSDADYLSLGTGSDVFDFAGDFHGAIVLRPTSLAAAQYLLANNTGTAGWALYTAAGGIPVLRIDGPGGSQYVVAGTGALVAHNTYVITFGRIGTTGHISVNGAATTTLAVETHAPATGTVMYLGRYVSAGTAATAMGIQELSLSDGTTTAAALAARGTATMSCRNAGRCIPTSADEVAYFGGDDYTIGGSWCGDYPTCSAAKTFTRTGTVVTREARYSWPALTPTQNGTVPRVATSGIYRQGYGARHASLSGWSGTNNLRLGTGNDVLDFTGDFTLCFSFGPTSVTGVDPTLFENTDYTEKGYAITLAQTTGALKLLKYGVLATKSAVTTNGSNLHNTNFGCVGRSGTTLFARLNNGSVTTTTGATDLVAATSTVAIVGVSASLGRPFVGDISEVFATTTPATAEYLTFLTDAAMRCTTQGNCFPRDADTVMHCNGDEFTGSVLRCGTNTGADPWTTNGTVTLNAPSFYQNVNAQRISASGAGPYSSANSFQWGTTTDVLDFPGSWTVCSSFDVTTASGQVINGGYDAGTQTGWAMTYVSGKLQCTVSAASGGAGTADTASTAASDGSLNLGCCGWDQNTDTIYALLNAAPIATGTKKYAPALTLPSYIGRRNAAGTELGGRVYEVLAINKAPTTAQLETIQRRWLNHQSLTGRALSNTHTIDTSTYHSAGKVWRRGANMQRQESARLFVSQTYSGEGVAAGPHQQTTPGFLIHGGYDNTAYSISPTGYTEGVTVTSNAALAPDGTMTATAVRERAGTTLHQLYMGLAGSATAGNKAYVASLYLRPVGAQNCLRAVYYPHLATLAEYSSMDIDLAADKQSTYTAGMNTPVNGHEHLADGWLRLWWASGSAPYAAGSVIGLGIRIQPGPSPCTGTTWAGSTAYGYDLWMPSHTTSSTTTSLPSLFPQPLCGNSGLSTTCTAETVTVPNPLRPNGSDWTNSLLQSEDLATTWSGVNTAVLVNSALAPDGSFTADKLYENDATNGVHYTLQAYTATAVPWTVSFKAKPAERSWLLVSPDAGASTASFDLSTCAAGAVSAGVTSTAAASSAPGWCDFSLTKTMAAGATSVRIFLCTAAGSCSYAGVAGSGVFLWGLQAEPASSASPYCPTTTTARTCGPGGATGKVITNLIKYSDAWDNATAWVPAGAAVTGNDRVGRTPGTFGDTVTVTADGASKHVARYFTATASRYTASFWIQGGTVSSATFGLYQSGWVAQTPAIVEGPGTIAGTTTVTVSGLSSTEWTRVKTTTDAALGAAGASFYLYPRATVGQLTGDSVGVQDAQLEESAAAGPYCGPTAAASRTCAPKQRWCVRAKDVTPGYGRSWSAIDALLWAQGVYGAPNSAGLRVYTNGALFWDLNGNGGGSELNRATYVHGFADGSTHTIVSCINDGAWSATIDGAAVALTVSGSAYTMSAFPSVTTVGASGASTAFWNGTIGSIDFNTTGDPKDFPSDRRTP